MLLQEFHQNIFQKEQFFLLLYLKLQFNPCAAKTVYIRFQANFRLNKIPVKYVTYLVVDAQLIKLFNLGDVYVSKYYFSFISSWKLCHKQFSNTIVTGNYTIVIIVNE